jgi:eukaryotic-like serine/threonine-protein kinase
MLEPQSSRFWQAALQSGLVDVAGLRACWEAIPEAKRTPDAIERRLARQSVEKRLLTLWQAQQIMGGRSSGYKIDKYILIDLVGQGGMGRVYLAKDTRLNRQVALKVLSRERMSNPRAIARFRREAKVGAQLQHENLVRIYDEGEANGICYLVMEYIDGKNVGQILADIGSIPPFIAVGVVRQIALGLEHARHKGLIHRDVNPLNVLVSNEGVAKLTDLGLAIDLGDPEDIVTRDGATVGTFDYIAPEQARHSRSVDTRSDIYALGCTLFHMLSGRVPFPQPSLPEKLYAHQMLEPEPISMLVSDVPPEVEVAIQKMMRKSMDERYQTPQEVALALEPYCPSVPVSLKEILATATTTRVATAEAIPLDGAVTVVSSRLGNLDSLATPVSPATTSPADSSASTATTANARSNSSSVTTKSPTPEILSSDPFGMIPIIDLGPVPPLSESGTRVLKPPFRLPFIPKKRLLAVAGIAGVVLLLTGAGLLLWAYRGGEGAAASWTTRGPRRTPSQKNQDRTGDPTSAAASEIVVRNANGEEFSEQTLGEAIRRASGRRGARIILNGPKPLEFEVTKALEAAGRDLTIEAGPNATPVIGVILTGAEPFLRVQSEGSLTIRGLTFRVNSADKRPQAPPVLLDGHGGLTLDRCEFQAQGPDRDLHAVVVEGRGAQFQGCVFRGFDRPIVFRSFPDSSIVLGQCLFVRDQMGGNPVGWAVCAQERTLRDVSGFRRVSFQHCTVVTGGLLEADAFTKEQPIKVTVENCVLRAATLMLAPTDVFPAAIQWSGQGNRYHISNAAWVVLPPKGFDGVANSPTDLDSWLKIAGAEPKTSGLPVAFVKEGDPPYENHAVGAFALSPRDGDHIPGIDPTKVGPGSGSKAK